MDTQPSPPMASGQVTPQEVAPVPQVAQVPQVAPVPQVAQVPLVLPVPSVAQVLPVPSVAQVPMGFFIVTGMQAYPGFEPYMSLKVRSYDFFGRGFLITKVNWLLI